MHEIDSLVINKSGKYKGSYINHVDSFGGRGYGGNQMTISINKFY